MTNNNFNYMNQGGWQNVQPGGMSTNPAAGQQAQWQSNQYRGNQQNQAGGQNNWWGGQPQQGQQGGGQGNWFGGQQGFQNNISQQSYQPQQGQQSGFNRMALQQQPMQANQQAQQQTQQQMPVAEQQDTPWESATNRQFGLGGIATALDRINSYQGRLDKYSNPHAEGRFRMANVMSGPGRYGQMMSENRRRLGSAQRSLEQGLGQALEFYGGDKQRAYDELMKQYGSQYGADAGYNSRFGDEGEMDMMGQMMKQMWGL